MKHDQIVALSARIAGRPTPTLAGKEITMTQYNALDAEQQRAVVHRVNGPHHDAKWARHAQLVPSYKIHEQRFFGTAVRWGRRNAEVIT